MSPNQTTQFILDFDKGDPLRLDLPLPQGEATAYDLLPALFAVADAITQYTYESLEAMGKTIGCGPGCKTCCYQLIPISEYEAVHLANVVRNMRPDQRSRIVKRFTRATTQLDASALMTELTTTFTHDVLDGRKMLEIKKRYWAQQIPCPFLENDSCSIYQDRPMACRQYSVTSPPANCTHIYTINEAHEIVLHPVDVGGTLAAFSGEGLQHSRIMPHVFSLLAERSLKAKQFPTLPAQQMMGRFLNLLATCFSRKR